MANAVLARKGISMKHLANGKEQIHAESPEDSKILQSRKKSTRANQEKLSQDRTSVAQYGRERHEKNLITAQNSYRKLHYSKSF